MAKDLFNRYLWLVDTIYRAGTITLDEINRKWLQCEMSNGEEISLVWNITSSISSSRMLMPKSLSMLSAISAWFYC